MKIAFLIIAVLGIFIAKSGVLKPSDLLLAFCFIVLFVLVWIELSLIRFNNRVIFRNAAINEDSILYRLLSKKISSFIFSLVGAFVISFSCFSLLLFVNFINIFIVCLFIPICSMLLFFVLNKSLKKLGLKDEFRFYKVKQFSALLTSFLSFVLLFVFMTFYTNDFVQVLNNDLDFLNKVESLQGILFYQSGAIFVESKLFILLFKALIKIEAFIEVLAFTKEFKFLSLVFFIILVFFSASGFYGFSLLSLNLRESNKSFLAFYFLIVLIMLFFKQNEFSYKTDSPILSFINKPSEYIEVSLDSVTSIINTQDLRALNSLNSFYLDSIKNDIDSSIESMLKDYFNSSDYLSKKENLINDYASWYFSLDTSFLRQIYLMGDLGIDICIWSGICKNKTNFALNQMNQKLNELIKDYDIFSEIENGYIDNNINSLYREKIEFFNNKLKENIDFFSIHKNKDINIISHIDFDNLVFNSNINVDFSKMIFSQGFGFYASLISSKFMQQFLIKLFSKHSLTLNNLTSNLAIKSISSSSGILSFGLGFLASEYALNKIDEALNKNKFQNNIKVLIKDIESAIIKNAKLNNKDLINNIKNNLDSILMESK